MPKTGHPDHSRQTPRKKLDAFVRINGGNGREYVFRTRDLSTKGLFLYTKVTHIYPIQIGSNLSLELYDYDATIHCTVTVVRVVEPNSEESASYPTGFGVSISEIDPDSRKRLESMLDRVGDGSAAY